MRVHRFSGLIVWLAGVPLAVGAQTVEAPANASKPETAAVYGDWHGSLSAGGVTLRLTMHLGETSSMNSLDEEVSMPAHMTVAGRRVMVEVAAIGGVFEGNLADGAEKIAGEWRQGAQRFPLLLERGAFPPPRRPQSPVAPFPYRAEEVGYDNARRPRMHLAGTLTLPEGRGPFPAVLLISGSGLQDRNGTWKGHQPYLVLADYLTRRGLAVLRVDDPGVGGSSGATPNDTYADYASGVEAGVAYLRARHEIDARRVALIGHSEGGLIAPIVASHDPSLAGIVLWAGPGVRGAELLVEQVRAMTLSRGAPLAAAEAAAQRQRRMMDVVLAAPDAATAREALKKLLSCAEKGAKFEAQCQAQVDVMGSPWAHAMAAYDPAPVLLSLHLPVLALPGGKDVQVVAAQNAPALQAALSSDPQARVVVLPGLNHLLQTADTGAVTEYGQIEETMAPAAQAAIGDWLVETLQARRKHP